MSGGIALIRVPNKMVCGQIRGALRQRSGGYKMHVTTRTIILEWSVSRKGHGTMIVIKNVPLACEIFATAASRLIIGSCCGQCWFHCAVFLPAARSHGGCPLLRRMQLGNSRWWDRLEMDRGPWGDLHTHTHIYKYLSSQVPTTHTYRDFRLPSQHVSHANGAENTLPCPSPTQQEIVHYMNVLFILSKSGVKWRRPKAEKIPYTNRKFQIEGDRRFKTTHD